MPLARASVPSLQIIVHPVIPEKIGAVEMALVWNLLHEDPACPSRVLLDKSAQRQVPIAVSVRHLTDYGSGGTSIAGRAVLAKRHGARRLPLTELSSRSRPGCPLSACISWRIGSTSTMALRRW